MTEPREYRGKRVDNGEWIEGIPYAEYMICGMTTAYYDDEVPMSEYREFDYVEIDPSTIGQYTGLKDKNGTKIFEGDIIKHGYFNKYCREKLTAKYIVKWGKCGFGISLACITEQDICEVIGTIHDEGEK